MSSLFWYRELGSGQIWLILAAAVLITPIALGIYRLFFGRLRHIPGPWTTNLTGFDLSMHATKGSRVYKLEELHARYGPVVRVGPNEVSVGDWHALRPIYAGSKTTLKDAKFYGFATFVGKNNIFQMLNPAEHAARRKLSSPPYSLQSVARLDSIIEDRAEALVRRLLEKSATSGTGTTDAYQLCGLFSFEVVCRAGFAKTFDQDDNSAALRLLNSMDASAPTLIFDQALPFLTSMGLGRRLPGFVGDCYRKRDSWQEQSREMVDHFLMMRSSGTAMGEGKCDKDFMVDSDKYLLSPLANGVDAFLGRKLTHEELVEEAMGYMFAGSGTTSSTLTYLLYAIARPENAHIQERLRTEVAGFEANSSVVTAARQNAYITAVIKEVFRLYPTIISTLPRVLAEPLQVGPGAGFTLPAGTVVGMQNWIHHRDPAVFTDPNRFEPERWLASTPEMEAALTPFSLGRRNCIGQNLAWQELYWAVVCIMRAGLRLRVGSEMTDYDMELEDRFNIAPRGRRLMLEVTRLL